MALGRGDGPTGSGLGGAVVGKVVWYFDSSQQHFRLPYRNLDGNDAAAGDADADGDAEA